MKKQTIVLAVAVTFLGIVVGVGAKTLSPVKKLPQVVNIDASGNALVRGTVVSVASTSLVVSSWGGNWTAALVSKPQMVGRIKTLRDIAAGDFVGVQGKVNTDTDWAINARVVRDYSYTTQKKPEQEKLIGGDKDEHGCLVAAGYGWCAVKNRCLRVWEEACK